MFLSRYIVFIDFTFICAALCDVKKEGIQFVAIVVQINYDNWL